MDNLQGESDRTWYAYQMAEFNVRYRDAAGDDGLREEYVALRDKCRALYESDEEDGPALDALYLERIAIERREPTPDMKIIKSVGEQFSRDIKDEKWPPRERP